MIYTYTYYIHIVGKFRPAQLILFCYIFTFKFDFDSRSFNKKINQTKFSL